ncbi:zinc finger BED domain-containing protein 4-like isoform X2 [Daktulosphaira vitifoliae]|uniref:zinc finger BED domain-containing protein 4-like isoform X2 n=1 Tax=Daktulosphaira vitifoliae TaxID=58002 RepID=UPI0021A9FB9A|nr:zinc finger BED domain-containing protein 4-like isoform X2 [Daktulosphaira vitifoliae]
MGKISKIWRHFDKVNKLSAKCKVCGKICLTSGNTSNLHSHLKNAHQLNSKIKESQKIDSDDADQIDNVLIQFDIPTSSTSEASDTLLLDISQRKKCQPLIEHCFNYVSSMKGGMKNSEITDALIYYICKDNVPFSTVEGSGFRHFLQVSCPLYTVPSRNTIKNKLDLKYDYLSKVFSNKLKKNNNFTLTSDIWTDFQMKSYIGVTIHFLEGTQFICGTLGVHELSKSHISENISEAFEIIMTQWEISKHQIIAIVTDNAANMKKAASDTFGIYKTIPCFAHTINLIANNALENCIDLNKLIDKIRNIVKFIKNSVNANDELRSIQKNDGLPEGKVLKLILDIKTRWNSLYYMIDRFLHLYRVVSSILLERPNAPDLITTREILIVKEVKNLMQPLEDLTKKISGEKYTTISTILPLINCINSAVNNCQTTSLIGIELKKNILFELDKRFKNLEIFNDFPLATLLDPRFKNLHFKDPVRCQKAIEVVKNMLIQKENSECVHCFEPTPSNELVDKKLDSFDLWSYHTSVSTIQVQNKTSPMYQELYDYLGKPVEKIDTKPLEAWEYMKSLYPNLYYIARQKLSIVGTSVPSERLFSKTGQTISKARNRLTGKHLSKLVFMSSLSEADWFSKVL